MAPSANLDGGKPQGREQKYNPIHAYLGIDEYVKFIGANLLVEVRKAFLGLL